MPYQLLDDLKSDRVWRPLLLTVRVIVSRVPFMLHSFDKIILYSLYRLHLSAIESELPMSKFVYSIGDL